MKHLSAKYRAKLSTGETVLFRMAFDDRRTGVQNRQFIERLLQSERGSFVRVTDLELQAVQVL